MPDIKRTYIAIDLKSFYASVECVERGLDPLDACLVVADSSRTDKTICLAVSPGLKSFGVGGRPRLFEVIQKINLVNSRRRSNKSSTSFKELMANPDIKVDYIVAKPRMAFYIDYSSRIYDIYLRFVSPEDMHIYSIDEVFIDATSYLDIYKMNAHDFAMMMIRTVLSETGVTATAGIGDNLYLSKVAMDIVAKKMPPDKDGVRIAYLSEKDYRLKLWNHMPLTDFWRVGKGTMNRLAPYGIRTMGDIAVASLRHEDLLYKIFGVNAELLIDHAWGWEPVLISDIKAYHPENRSLSSGQVLSEAYSYTKALTVITEMADALSLEMVDKGIVTDQIVLHIGYDVDSLNSNIVKERYNGPLHRDHYGRMVPSSAHGSLNLIGFTSSSEIIVNAARRLFQDIVNPILLVRRLNIIASHMVGDRIAKMERMKTSQNRQLDLFTDYEKKDKEDKEEELRRREERKRQQLILDLQKKFGKNVILKGFNFAEGATQKDRNRQIGGHQA
ncbi:MAG: DNA methylase [Muribaculaceae bacterium]|nr:DNA methylase [Muribaculaceae bacterium]